MNIIGAVDTVTKAYIRENEVFADAFNYFIYHGRQVINPQNLKELDTAEIVMPLNTKGKNTKKQLSAIQKYRDVLKAATIMMDDCGAYVLLGIENQTGVHYAMPVRNMIYDALQYGQQVADIAGQHRKEKNQLRGHNTNEFLSGFYKSDRLLPVVTLVIHFNEEIWDGPLSLSEMMEIDGNLAEFIQDYKINLIDPKKIPDDDLIKFQSSLREVLGCIKYSKDKEKLAAFINNNPRMNMDVQAARVIEAITHMSIEIQEGAEVIDMCQAIEEMVEDGKKEGRLEILMSLVQDGLLNVTEAAKRANMTLDEFEKSMNLH